MAVARISVGVNSGNFVPFSGASGPVDLNNKNLVNVNNFSVGSTVTTISPVYIAESPLNVISNQRVLTINHEDTWMSFGSLVGANFAATWYPRAVTPTAANFGITSEGFNMTFNIPTAGNDMFFQEAGSANRVLIRGTKTSGVLPSFSFFPPSNTGATASTEAPTYRFFTYTKTHAAGNIVIQRDWIIEGATHAFSSGTNTITDLYTLYVDKPSVTAPSGATRIWVANFNGNVQMASGGILNIQNGSITTDTSQGLKILNSTSQKLGFFNATPIVQPTTAITAAAHASVGGSPVVSNDTFGGYSIGQIVTVLKNLGFIA